MPERAEDGPVTSSLVNGWVKGVGVPGVRGGLRGVARRGLVIAVAAGGLWAVTGVGGGLVSSAGAQVIGGDAIDEAASPQELLEDFVFYVNVARFDLATANARALLDSGVTPTELVAVVEDEVGLAERFEASYLRALRFVEVEPLAAELWGFYEEGLRERARDPQRVRENIELLKGNARQRRVGGERLIAAGQYAVPELLEVLQRGQEPALEAEVRDVLERMGSDAVMPLAVALPNLDETLQSTLCYLLGRIQNTSARPFLYALESSTADEGVREAARAGIELIDGAFDPIVEASGLFRLLGTEVLSESSSYTAFEGERHQLLWSFEPRQGLVATPIYTEVYHEAVAMELAERALELDGGDVNAVALWVKSNFRRENEQPAGYDNPAYASGKPDAEYYAVTAGAGPLQIILAQALEGAETYVARRAIGALDKTAGASTLLERAEGVQPLVSALSYPDRRTRYEAALAIAGAQPKEAFGDSERVVPLLAGVLREADERYAVVLSVDTDRQQSIRVVLEGLGYTVLAPASSLDGVREQLARVASVEVIVSDLDGEAAVDTIERVRRAPRLRATPLVATVSREDVRRLGPRFRSDDLTMVLRDGITGAELGSGVSQIVRRATGEPLDAGEAMGYSIRALNALFNLAVSGNDVLDVSASSVALVGALEESQGEIQFRVGEVLSYIDREQVQVALMDAALDSTGNHRVRMLGLVTDSAKRHGNLLRDRQVRRAIDLTESADLAEATSAAALVGALGLPSDRIVPLILGDRGGDVSGSRAQR